MSLEKVNKFGTAPVFFTAISTILGAIMILRFGFAIGTIGLIGTLLIILIGHAVTIPTALALAEIATNQKVEGGGEYYIISRSFGLVIGSSIGIALYFSQAISVAFYIIAFAEAFSSLFDYLLTNYDLHATLVWLLERKQTVSIPALMVLTIIVLKKGAGLGVKTLYVVVATLALSLISFFIGQTPYSKTHKLDLFVNISTNTDSNHETGNDTLDTSLLETKDNSTSTSNERDNSPIDNSEGNGSRALGFFAVFAIIFPAFTGMTAGVGLSGDLKSPSRSIPLGTLAATLTGMLVYILISFKLAISASPESLADTSKLVMAEIAWQGWWLIPIGLAAATVSSAIGSILVAPRTLQAIARDGIMPSNKLNSWLSKGRGKSDEPFNATALTVAIAFVFVLAGGLNAVAQIISMFFMVTYGSLCLISFLQHFAADPSYRPTFKSRWYLSLFGALACFGLMFFMNTFYAVSAIIFLILFYVFVNRSNPDKKNLALIFQGVIFQVSRSLQIFLQKADKEKSTSWRPSVICITENSFDRLAAFDLLRWISYKYGFGTYIHKITDFLTKQTNQDAKEAKARLIKMAEKSNSNVYIDTLISPSYTSAIAQIIQLPGISGSENNLLMFEYSKQNPVNLKNIIDNFRLIKSVDFDVIILGSSDRGFGFKKEIHVWITPYDYENANLMILLAYIILGHPDWKKAHIKIFAIYPEETSNEYRRRLYTLIDAGQLPISTSNIKIIPHKPDVDARSIINENSRDADLSILGFRDELVRHDETAVFEGYNELGSTVFVNAAIRKVIK